HVTGVQTCALPISASKPNPPSGVLRSETSAVTVESAILTLRFAATSFRAEWKQEAQPAAKSCSGLVAPPGPPMEVGVSSVTSSKPSSLTARAWERPLPVAVAVVLYRGADMLRLLKIRN